MKLYDFPVAPNPTKVRVYLAEKGLDVPSERVSLPDGEQRSEQFLAKNPMGKLPVLELDDGKLVTESLAIIEYFEETHPQPTMWGDTPAERALNRSLERLCDLGVLINIGRVVHATNSPLGLPKNEAVAEHGHEALAKALAVLDTRIGGGPFVAGERITVADCTLHAGLAFGEFFGVKLDPAFANVANWWERFRQRPSANLA